MTCDSCFRKGLATVSAIVDGHYYKNVCASCLGHEDISSNAAGYARRRGYEDNAQDTIQPYDAKGPAVEFARLYPDKAEKVYSKKVLDDLKRQM